MQNARGTLIEFHIRFYEGGMIYAEIELGRSALLHLIDRRMYANRYFIRRLSSRLSSADLEYLRAATERYKCMHPKSWPEWGIRDRFMTPSIKRKIQLLAVLSDWRMLALVMMASIVSSVADGPAIVPLLTALMICVYVLAPKRTQ